MSFIDKTLIKINRKFCCEYLTRGLNLFFLVVQGKKQKQNNNFKLSKYKD